MLPTTRAPTNRSPVGNSALVWLLRCLASDSGQKKTGGTFGGGPLAGSCCDCGEGLTDATRRELGIGSACQPGARAKALKPDAQKSFLFFGDL